jgi:hypothetical protein
MACRFGMRRRFLEPKRRPRRRIARDRRQRLRLAAERAVERVDHVFRPPEPPRQRKSRHVKQRADGLEPEPLERAHGVGIEAEGGDVQRLQLVMPAKAGIHVGGLL